MLNNFIIVFASPPKLLVKIVNSFLCIIKTILLSDFVLREASWKNYTMMLSFYIKRNNNLMLLLGQRKLVFDPGTQQSFFSTIFLTFKTEKVMFIFEDTSLFYWLGIIGEDLNFHDQVQDSNTISFLPDVT